MNLGTTKEGKKIDFDFAEAVVKSNKKPDDRKNILFEGLTTSKLRNLLEQVNNVYSIVLNNQDAKLSEDVLDKIAYLKVKFAYESGRDKSVKKFVEQTYVREIINEVLKDGSRKKYLEYCKYFEALVAYAKFYGMEDK